jgi:hypothetical protein
MWVIITHSRWDIFAGYEPNATCLTSRPSNGPVQQLPKQRCDHMAWSSTIAATNGELQNTPHKWCVKRQANQTLNNRKHNGIQQPTKFEFCAWSQTSQRTQAAASPSPTISPETIGGALTPAGSSQEINPPSNPNYLRGSLQLTSVTGAGRLSNLTKDENKNENKKSSNQADQQPFAPTKQTKDLTNKVNTLQSNYEASSTKTTMSIALWASTDPRSTADFQPGLRTSRQDRELLLGKELEKCRASVVEALSSTFEHYMPKKGLADLEEAYDLQMRIFALRERLNSFEMEGVFQVMTNLNAAGYAAGFPLGQPKNLLANHSLVSTDQV